MNHVFSAVIYCQTFFLTTQLMKYLHLTLIFLVMFSGEHLALDVENYAAHVQALSRNETFLDAYADWAFKLFSKTDYLFGDAHRRFPCAVEASDSQRNVSVSVHSLRPSDVTCVAALGDSFTTGLAAHAITPNELLVENRGLSWSIGGDYTFSKVLSLPNILRQYNPKLAGFSEQTSPMNFNGQYVTRNRLNVAESGDYSVHLSHQADRLIDRLKNAKICDWNEDWKIITIFVGSNDLCSFCDDANLTAEAASRYTANVRDALDKLYNASIPRTLVNLVLAPDVRQVKKLSQGGYVCQTLLKKICPCATSSALEQSQLLDDYIAHYQRAFFKLIHSGRYDDRDDFTVVIQPFLAKAELPLIEDEEEIDFSYFAPDCFHFSGKGHAQAALSLWNNMLEPVGGKSLSWRLGESLKCPTQEYPFIFTSKNSAQAMIARKNVTIAQTTRRASTTVSTDTTTTTTDELMNSTVHHHKKHKKDKSDSDSLSNKSTFLVFSGFLFILMCFMIAAVMKRKNIRQAVSERRQRRFKRFDNSADLDEMDEVEVWSHPHSKPTRSDRHETTETHGTRITFE